MEPAFIVLLVVAAIASNIVMVWALRKSGQKTAALKELAAQNGWRFDQVKATSRIPGHIEIASKDWSVTLHSGSSGNSSSSTVWTDRSLAIPSGLAVYAPPMPDKTQEMFNKMMDKSGTMGRIMLNSFVGGLGPDAKDLRAVEDDDPATLLATPGAEAVFDALKGHNALMELNAFGSNPANAPALIRSPEGLSLRIPRKIDKPEELKAYITAGQTLAAAMKA